MATTQNRDQDCIYTDTERPPLGYIVRVENMEAQHIHHPNVVVVADDPAELRAIEAALDVHITPIIPATSGEPAAPGPSRLTSPEYDDLESFGSSPGYIRYSKHSLGVALTREAIAKPQMNPSP